MFPPSSKTRKVPSKKTSFASSAQMPMDSPQAPMPPKQATTARTKKSPSKRIGGRY